MTLGLARRTVLAIRATAIAALVIWPVIPGFGQEIPTESSQSASTPSMETPLPEESPEPTSPTASEEILAPFEEEFRPGTADLPVETQGEGGRRYVVRKGDTLWGISNRFLRDSFLWPKVWKNNHYILNPDLIYPGNILFFPPEGGPPVLLPPSDSVPTPPPAEAQPEPAPLVEKAPAPPEEIRIEIVKPAAPPPKPGRSVDSMLASSGYIISAQETAGTVVGARDLREIIGQGEIAYYLPADGLRPAIGDLYTVYRVVRKVYHPNTGRYLGNLVRILGTTKVIGTRPDEETISGTVLISYDFIRKGDSLTPYQPELPSESEGGPEKAAVPRKGFIVEAKEDRKSQSQYDVVYLDLGRRNGIRTGDRFKVIREGEKTSFFSPGGGVRLPRRDIGELRVIAVRENTSTATITHNTEVIFRGDQIEASARP